MRRGGQSSQGVAPCHWHLLRVLLVEYGSDVFLSKCVLNWLGLSVAEVMLQVDHSGCTNGSFDVNGS